MVKKVKVKSVYDVEKNRRCRNTKNKKYRLFECDIWGRLAVKSRYSRITNRIAKKGQQAC
jgi:hypothetical protein